MSDQLSSGAVRRSVWRRRASASGRAGVFEAGQEIHAGEALESFGDGEAFAVGAGRAVPVAQLRLSACPQGGRHQCLAIGHQIFERGAGAVPFEHGEFARVQGAVFAISEGVGEGEEFGLAGGEQFFHGEFGRGVEVEDVAAAAVDRLAFRLEGMEMEFHAGRMLQYGGIDFDEVFGLEPCPDGALDGVAGEKKGPSVAVFVGAPPIGCRQSFVFPVDLG